VRVAVDLGGTKLLTVVEGEGPGGPFRARTKVPTLAAEGREAVLARIDEQVAACLHQAGAGAGALESLGICVPGAVEPDTGVVSECSNLPGWDRVPLGTRLSDRWGVPVTVTNDAKAACWAEYSSGAGVGTRHMAFVTLSTGIGAGFVFDGRLYQGARGIAGELGETRDDTGQTSERGASGSALWARFGIRAEDLRALYDAGDPRAREGYDHLVTRLGRLLANVATLLDPERIVVGGGLSQLGPWFLDALGAVVAREAYARARETPLVRAHWSDEAGARGLLALLPPSLGGGPRAPSA